MPGRLAARFLKLLPRPSAPGYPWRVFGECHDSSSGFPRRSGPYRWMPVLLDRAGNLYGTTFVSQVYGGGTAFELTPAHRGRLWTETVLYRFPAYRGDAANPQAGFISDSTSNLYATSQNGGATSPAPSGSYRRQRLAARGRTPSCTRWLSVSTPGLGPGDQLGVWRGGLLYGTTPYGGTGNCLLTKTKGCGTVFEVRP